MMVVKSLSKSAVNKYFRVNHAAKIAGLLSFSGDVTTLSVCPICGGLV